MLFATILLTSNNFNTLQLQDAIFKTAINFIKLKCQQTDPLNIEILLSYKFFNLFENAYRHVRCDAPYKMWLLRYLYMTVVRAIKANTNIKD